MTHRKFHLLETIKKYLLSPVVLYILTGMFIGIFILHPLTMVIYWFEFYDAAEEKIHLWYFIKNRINASFTGEMLVMNGIFLFLGGIIGVAGGIFHKSLSSRNQLQKRLEEERAMNLKTQIKNGENEFVEFKSSVRWDYRKNAINKSLENEILKSIAGLMNLNGGTLIIGVSDNGEILGLEKDYMTLARKNADGFIQLLHTLVATKIDKASSTLVQAAIQPIDGKDVCRVMVSPSPRPVYVQNGSSEPFYLRIGNSTRRLNVREALKYIKQHWG